MTKYDYNGTELYVGLTIKDKNGFEWNIIWCGAKRVKAVQVAKPEASPVYVAHWHFVENIVNRGSYTTPQHDNSL